MNLEPSTSATKNVLDIFKGCIQNGEEFQKICDKKASDKVKNHPLLKHLLNKTQEDMKAIELLSEKVKNLKSSNYKNLKNDISEVISKLDAMSVENIAKIKEVIASSNTSKLRKKIAENNEAFNKLSEDENIQELAKILLDQNKKIIKCLKYAHSLLPKFFGSSSVQDEGQRVKKKLFIIGDDLSRVSTTLGAKRLQTIGEVTIHCDLDASRTADGRLLNYPDELSGFLQQENSEKIEVVLKLKEELEYNLIDFSGEDSKMSATISIPGVADEKIEVVEINISQQGPELMALVENDDGEIDKVRVQLVPDKEVHGKILEFQKVPENEENLEDIQLSLMENSLMHSTLVGLPLEYATPKRQPIQTKKHDAAAIYGTAMRKSPRLERELIDSVHESFKIDQSVRTIQEALEPVIDNVAQNLVDFLLEGNLSDESAIDFADVSDRSVKNINDTSANISNRSAAAQRSMRQNQILGNSAGFIDDVSEIQYEDLSSRTPERSARSFKATPEKSARYETPMRQQTQLFIAAPYESPARQLTLSSRYQTPSPRGVREGALINLTPQSPTAARYNQLVGNFRGDLIDLGQHEDESIHFSPQQRRKVLTGLNKSMPMRQAEGMKNMNRSLPQKKLNAQVQRPFAPIKVVPSRIPENASSNVDLSIQITPTEHRQLRNFQQPNCSNLMEVEPPFSDSFKALEYQPSQATKINREVNQLRLMENLKVQQPQEFAAKFDSSSLLDDESLDLTDSSMNATFVDPPPQLYAQPAADFAARFDGNEEFLDDINFDDDMDVSINSPRRRIRVMNEPQAPPRRANTNIPRRYQNAEPKLLDFDD